MQPPCQPPTTQEKEEGKEKGQEKGQVQGQEKHLAPRVEKTPPLTATTWEAYKTAYFNRYQVHPTRNAMINGQLANFVKRIGADDAPHVAAFFLRNNSQWYVQKGHSVGSMINDAEKLHTEWKRGKHITTTTARQIDKQQTTYDAFASIKPRSAQ